MEHRSISIRQWIRRIVLILVGSFIYAFAINGLYIPHSLLSGGVTGIAMIFNYIFKWPISVTVIILNIPLFIGGYLQISKRFAYLSILGIFSVSLFLMITKGWAVEVESTMVASIFGGILAGTGTGIVLKNQGSLGGTDILSVLINKYFSFSIGGISTAFNTIVLALAAFQFNLELAMYTMISIFVSSKALDAIQEGFNRRKTILLVSDHSQELAQNLFQNVQRGITFFNGEGAYTGQQKKIIYMVVRITELAKVKDIVRKTDPNAFMSIIDTKETEGKGFDIGDIF